MSYLAQWAILSLDDAKREGCGGGTDKDRQLEELINRVTGMVEDYLGGRHLVSRTIDAATYLTEWHTFYQSGSDLLVNEWPIRAVTEIREDASRAFAASSILAVTTDYLVSAPAGKIIRVSNSLQSSWAIGWRAVKVTYAGGYATAADVPWKIRDIALKIVALQWHETTHGRQGVSAISDALGSTTRFFHARLTPDQRADLEEYARRPWGLTGERDA